MEQTQEITPKLRPFGGRVIVVDIKPSETEHNGVVIPATQAQVLRGVVEVSVEHDNDDRMYSPMWRPPAPGEVVYYTHGIVIGDKVVVDYQNIVAVES